MQSRRIVATNVPFFDVRLGTYMNVAQTGVNITMPLNTSRINYGSVFDTGNYTFTAPNDGIYLFVWMVSVNDIDNSGNYVGFNITTSNYGSHEWENIQKEHTAQTYAAWSGSCMEFMDANDTAYMALRGSGTVDWQFRGDTSLRGIGIA